MSDSSTDSGGCLGCLAICAVLTVFCFAFQLFMAYTANASMLHAGLGGVLGSFAGGASACAIGLLGGKPAEKARRCGPLPIYSYGFPLPGLLRKYLSK